MLTIKISQGIKKKPKDPPELFSEPNDPYLEKRDKSQLDSYKL
jgi:hypothetical protein